MSTSTPSSTDVKKAKTKAVQLSELDEALLMLLEKAEVPLWDEIGLMVMMKEDEDAKRRLLVWMWDNEPNDTEVMQWFGRYFRDERGFKGI